MFNNQRTRTITASRSQLGFSLPDENSTPWRVWYRYLTVDGERIFNTGNVCDTCPCFFQRLPGNRSLNISVGQRLSDKLNSGIRSLRARLLNDAEMILPDGEYAALLLRIRPTICCPGDANDYFANERVDEWQEDDDPELPEPKTPYYRLRTRKRAEDGAMYLFVECLVPLSPPNTLNRTRVEHYRSQIEAGSAPTALALGLWDFKQSDDKPEPIDQQDIHGHDFLCHYLIDGHHKVQAAAELGQEITLLTYVRRDNYFGGRPNPEHLDFLRTPHRAALTALTNFFGIT